MDPNHTIRHIQRAIRLAQHTSDAARVWGEVLRAAESTLDGTQAGCRRYLEVIAATPRADLPPAISLVIHAAQAALQNTQEENT